MGPDGIRLSSLETLVSELKELPGIGEKTATRLAYFLLRRSEGACENLAASIVEARRRIRTCPQCSNFTEDTICAICADPRRSDDIVCVVEEPSDVAAFEKSRQFSGKYHVLHGALSPLDGLDESKLRIAPLVEKVSGGIVKEIVLATNPTVEGDTTALYIARLLKYNEVKISRIAHGIPVGGEIEYQDGATLGKALQNRVPLS